MANAAVADRPVPVAASAQIAVPTHAHAARSEDACSTIVGARGNNLQERRPSRFRSACSPASPACPARASRRWSTTRCIAHAAHELNGAAHEAGAVRRDRGPGALRQGHRHRPEPDRPHAALATRPPTPACSRRSASCSPQVPEARARGYDAGPLQLQREGRPLRGLPGRRRDQGRDALPAGRLRALRRLPRQALQPRDARDPLQGQEHPRGAGHDGRGRAALLPARAGDRAQAADAARRGPRLHHARPERDHAVGRRGAAREAGARAVPSATPAARSTSSTSRPPACTSTTSSSCSTCCTACATRATPSSSSSTTSTSSRPPTGSSTWGPKAAPAAARIVATGTPGGGRGESRSPTPGQYPRSPCWTGSYRPTHRKAAAAAGLRAEAAAVWSPGIVANALQMRTVLIHTYPMDSLPPLPASCSIRAS